MVKNPSANAGEAKDTNSIPGSGIPWGRKWQPTRVLGNPTTEEPGKLQSMGSQRVRHD